ncbi:MAG: hypothetical protein ACI8Y4_004281 [Candidatus Poriferisodalaceae bacterium]|jgi:hypothetical protein
MPTIEGTHCRATVGAAVRPQTHCAGVVAGQQYWLVPQTSGDEFARCGHFALMADEHPTRMEDPLQFPFEDGRVGIQPSRHPIVADQSFIDGRTDTIDLAHDDPAGTSDTAGMEYKSCLPGLEPEATASSLVQLSTSGFPSAPRSVPGFVRRRHLRRGAALQLGSLVACGLTCLVRSLVNHGEAEQRVQGKPLLLEFAHDSDAGHGNSSGEAAGRGSEESFCHHAASADLSWMTRR